MVEENSCFVQPNMRCSNEIEITLNPDEIFKEEVLNFDIDKNNNYNCVNSDIDKNNNYNYVNSDTSINFIIIILAFLILRDISM